ncbi:MAG: hypothetical protein QM503_08555 [Bacteroidota bacterium]
MKYLFAIILLLFSVSKTADAQEYMYHHSLVTLSMGVAVPAYDFGSAKGINVSSYATLGTNIVAEASYFYSWHAGIAVMINYNVNPVDDTRLAEGYLNSSPAFRTVVANSESFRDLSGLVGMVFDIPANDYFSFVFKMMGGLRNVYKPATYIETTTIFSSINYYESSANETVFAFLGSFGVRAIVNEHFNVHLNASYIGSTFNYTYLRNSRVVNQEAHIGVLSISGGVSYFF